MRRNVLKKLVCVMLIVAIVLSFASCSFCRHEWTQATCTEPGTCRLCGRVDKSAPAMGHDFEEASCLAPRTCRRCDETEGEKLPHTYEDGYCIECYGRSPDFVDFNEIGFVTTYGMTEWVSIEGYAMSKNRVKVWGDNISFKNLKGNYFISGYIDWKDLKEVTDIGFSTLKNPITTTYSVVSNDVLQCYDGTTWTIDERKVFDDSAVIIKTTRSKWDTVWDRYDYYSIWCVPADLLDFTTITPGEGEDKGYYYIYFKK